MKTLSSITFLFLSFVTTAQTYELNHAWRTTINNNESVNKPEFLVYYQYDFESQPLGNLSSAQIDALFAYGKVHNYGYLNSIVNEQKNDHSTKALRLSQEPGKGGSGLEVYNFFPEKWTEIYFSYSVKFNEEFQWTGGGKLPGIIGYPEFEMPLNDDEGFYYGLNFKQGGKLATYHYDRTQKTIPWGNEIHLYDKIFFNNNNWYNITQRVVRNSFTNGISNADGIEEVWVDGRLIFQRNNLRILDSDSLFINGFALCAFYGNSNAEKYYYPTHITHVSFDDLTMWVNTSDSTFGKRKLHSTEDIIETPYKITDRNFKYTKIITKEDTLQNSDYGHLYSNLIHEGYLINAGAGKQVSFNVTSSGLGMYDYLIIYDGKTTDSDILIVRTGQMGSFTITSSGQYMYVYFVADSENGNTGFQGEITFTQ